MKPKYQLTYEQIYYIAEFFADARAYESGKSIHRELEVLLSTDIPEE